MDNNSLLTKTEQLNTIEMFLMNGSNCIKFTFAV